MAYLNIASFIQGALPSISAFAADVLPVILGAGITALATLKVQRETWNREESKRNLADKKQEIEKASAERAAVMVALYDLIAAKDFLTKTLERVMESEQKLIQRGDGKALTETDPMWEVLYPKAVVPDVRQLSYDALTVLNSRKLHDLANRLMDADVMFRNCVGLWKSYTEAYKVFNYAAAELMMPDGTIEASPNDSRLRTLMPAIKHMADIAGLIRDTTKQSEPYVSSVVEDLRKSLDGIGGGPVKLTSITLKPLSFEANAIPVTPKQTYD